MVRARGRVSNLVRRQVSMKYLPALIVVKVERVRASLDA
jgi:hypothetical protein